MPSVIPLPDIKAILVPASHLANVQPTDLLKWKSYEYEGHTHICMPHDMYHTHLLANKGVAIPSPIRYHYSWPGRFTPYDHQLITSDFLTKHLRSFCFNDIGTGKTLSLLWAADYLMQIGLVKKVLIMSTLSTLWNVWDDEIFKSFPHRKAVVLHTTKANRVKRLSGDYDFYILNHDGIKVVWNDLMKRPDINLIINDEGAEFSNGKTEKYKALKRIASREYGRFLWWATGSPMPGAPTDIWAQARMVNPESVPRFFGQFRDKVMVSLGDRWVPRRGWEETAYATVQPSIRFVRDKCLDLPPCVTETRNITMSKVQGAAYKELESEFYLEMTSGLITAANEGVKLGKLAQIAGGAVYDTNKDVHEFHCPDRMNALKDIVKEAGGKAIIFSPYKHTIALIQRELSKNYSTAVVHGDVSPGKRSKIFREFTDEDLQLLIAHPKTMAHGLDLTRSHVIVWWQPPPSFRIYEQANGRITRPGQVVPQTIYRLIGSPVEKGTYGRLDRNEKLQGLLTELLTERD